MDSITKKEIKIQVRMDADLHEQLSKEAQKNERSLSGQVRYYVLKGLKAQVNYSLCYEKVFVKAFLKK